MESYILIVSLQEEKKSPQKTKEELEKEKQSALASRITPLADTSSMNTDQLTEIAKTLHEQIRALVTSMYDTEQRYKRQQYDVSDRYIMLFINYRQSD